MEESLRELRVTHGESYRDGTVTNFLLALRSVLAHPQGTSTLLVDHVTQSLCVHLVHQYANLAIFSATLSRRSRRLASRACKGAGRNAFE